MNLKFSHKVFLAFLLNSLIIVISILLIGRYFSLRHFEEYVVKAEAAKGTKLVDALRQEYRRRGNWDSVLKDTGLWFGISVGPGIQSGTGPGGAICPSKCPRSREKEYRPHGLMIPPHHGPPPGPWALSSCTTMPSHCRQVEWVWRPGEAVSVSNPIMR